MKILKKISFNSINLLIKTDLDISLHFNNGKSISNERFNSCKHLKRVKNNLLKLKVRIINLLL